jgi:DNA-binding NtrC family response regulator
MAKKILLVDDEVTVRDLLKDTFVIEGYDVRLAEGAETAFEILKVENIEVIFLDLKLFGQEKPWRAAIAAGKEPSRP